MIARQSGSSSGTARQSIEDENDDDDSQNYSELARQAAMNPRNSGCGEFGFDKNSG